MLSPIIRGLAFEIFICPSTRLWNRAVCYGRDLIAFVNGPKPFSPIKICVPTISVLLEAASFQPATKRKISFVKSGIILENAVAPFLMRRIINKAVHRCRVCDSPDHAVLTCAKRKYPIPSSQSSSASSSTSTGYDQNS